MGFEPLVFIVANARDDRGRGPVFQLLRAGDHRSNSVRVSLAWSQDDSPVCRPGFGERDAAHDAQSRRADRIAPCGGAAVGIATVTLNTYRCPPAERDWRLTFCIACCRTPPRSTSNSSARRSSESRVGFNGWLSSRLTVDWFNPVMAASLFRDTPRRCRSKLSSRATSPMMAARRSAFFTLAAYTEVSLDNDMHIRITVTVDAKAHSNSVLRGFGWCHSRRISFASLLLHPSL